MIMRGRRGATGSGCGAGADAAGDAEGGRRGTFRVDQMIASEPNSMTVRAASVTEPDRDG